MALVLGGVVAVPVGIVVGLPALRLRGVDLAVVTLGFAAAIQVAAFNRGFPGAPIEFRRPPSGRRGFRSPIPVVHAPGSRSARDRASSRAAPHHGHCLGTGRAVRAGNRRRGTLRRCHQALRLRGQRIRSRCRRRTAGSSDRPAVSTTARAVRLAGHVRAGRDGRVSTRARRGYWQESCRRGCRNCSECWAGPRTSDP